MEKTNNYLVLCTFNYLEEDTEEDFLLKVLNILNENFLDWEDFFESPQYLMNLNNEELKEYLFFVASILFKSLNKDNFTESVELLNENFLDKFNIEESIEEIISNWDSLEKDIKNKGFSFFELSDLGKELVKNQNSKSVILLPKRGITFEEIDKLPTFFDTIHVI